MDAPKPTPSKVVLDEDAPAVAVLTALFKVLPGSFLEWEPESIWIELERQGIDVPLPNRARAAAAITILWVPSFYWDAVTFEKTALAFDGRPPHPDILEEATPAQLAWAVVEAAWIRKLWGHHAVEFRHEPGVYAATVLHRDGYARAPEQLSFAQALLDRMNPDGEALATEVRRRWDDGADAKDSSFDESPVGVQLARLAAVRLHVEERRAAAERML